MALTNLGHYIIRLTCSNAQNSSRCLYSRWTHRRPSRVMLQTLPTTDSFLKTEKIIDLDPEALLKSREKHAEKIKTSKSASTRSIMVDNAETMKQKPFEEETKKGVFDSQKIKEKRTEALQLTRNILKTQKVFDANGDVIYEKLKDNDGRVSTLLIKLKSKKERARAGQVLVEGWRLIVDGLHARCSLKYVIFSRTTDLEQIKPHLPDKGLKLFKIPYKEIQMWSDVETSSGLLGIFETPTPENVHRQGKLLPLQIICENIRNAGNLGAILRAAVGVGCNKVLLMKGCVDLWDPKVVRSAAGAHFRLPIYSSIDWDGLPQLVNPSSSVFIADNNSKIQLMDETKPKTHQSVDVEAFETVEELHIPVLPYYSVEYSALDSITLMIGGETEGISEESYRFAAGRNGLRINIPLQKGVDSLNTGMATAVIAFEIKKQLLEAQAKKNTFSATQ